MLVASVGILRRATAGPSPATLTSRTFLAMFSHFQAIPGVLVYFRQIQGIPIYSSLFYVTAALQGKGDQSQEIARFARMCAIYFYLDPFVL